MKFKVTKISDKYVEMHDRRLGGVIVIEEDSSGNYRWLKKAWDKFLSKPSKAPHEVPTNVKAVLRRGRE